MTTSLAERYIAATITGLPEDMRAEVRPELEASIADAIEARVLSGEDRDTAERAVLTELGDPAVLAAGYADRPLQLIGPKYYMHWWRLLKRMLVIIPPIVFVVVIIAQLIAGDNIGTVISEAVVATLSTILHVCFWVTLAFAVMERTGTDAGLSWDIDHLPEPRDNRAGWSDMIGSLVFIGLMVFGILWDQLLGLMYVDEGRLPILNPELWPWAMTGLFVLLGLEALFAVGLYLRAGWNVTMAVVNTILALLIFAWFITMLVRGELFSDPFVQISLTNAGSPDALETVAIVFGAGVGIVAIWDIIDGWVKTYRASVDV